MFRHGRETTASSRPPVTSSTVSCAVRPSRRRLRRVLHGLLDLAADLRRADARSSAGSWTFGRLGRRRLAPSARRTPCVGLGVEPVGVQRGGLGRRGRRAARSPARCALGAPLGGAAAARLPSEALRLPRCGSSTSRRALCAARRQRAAGRRAARRAGAARVRRRRAWRVGLERGRLAAARAARRPRRRRRRERGGDRHGLRPRGGHRLGDRHHLLAGEEPRAQEGGERQEAGGARDRARTRRARAARESSPAASASRRQGWQCERWRARRRGSRAPSAVLAGGGDDRLDALAALAGDELVVLLGQAPAGAEERRLDGGRLMPMRSPISR